MERGETTISVRPNSVSSFNRGCSKEASKCQNNEQILRMNELKTYLSNFIKQLSEF